MCGICGEFYSDNTAERERRVRTMMHTLTHRGPDDSGVYVSNDIGLGHTRLSILDLSSHGCQPMWSNDKTMCIVFNGEIYNFKEIREELKKNGFVFRSDSDTEVLVNAIQCWGIDEALRRCIGMFAFAVWDLKNKEVLLCRDRAGIKPLYYYLNDNRLLFASELKALSSHPAFEKKLNSTAVSQYFICGYVLNPLAIFENTFKVSPGHYLRVNQCGEVEDHEYWDIASITPHSFGGSFDDACERAEELFEDAFKYRLVSDVPVGVFLSGGIDSSLVAAILKKKVNADVINITIGFEEEKYNEAEKAVSVAKQLQLQHIIHTITQKEAQSIVLNFSTIYDEPFADTSGIPTYLLSNVARQYIKVALSADGGDEQFFGYDANVSYRNTYQYLKTLPLLMRTAMSRAMLGIIPYKRICSAVASRKGTNSWQPQVIARYEKGARVLGVSGRTELLQIMNEKGWSPCLVKDIYPKYDKSPFTNTILSNECLDEFSGNIYEAMMRLDYQVFMRDDILTKVDRASMAVSLECRDPFLDHRIAEFAFSLPIEYHYTNGEHKRIPKTLLRKWISEDIVKAPKRGFVVPLYHWLRGVWKPTVMEYLTKERVSRVGILDADSVLKEVNTFYKYHGCRAEKIWMMLNFQMWAERWLT